MIEITKSRAVLMDTIRSAHKFLWVVAFQLSDERILDAFVERSKRGVDIRIVTLPVDSYGDTAQRETLSKKHRELKGIEYCDWEIGDPSLTSSSRSGVQRGGGGDKWYSLHGKFIVTENRVIALSANLDPSDNWEVFFYSDSRSHINNFREKFEELVNLFCNLSTVAPEIRGRLFDSLGSELQKRLQEEKRLLVPYYPANLIRADAELEDGLYICPFDIIARHALERMVDGAKKTLWIAGETLTDQDVVRRILGARHGSSKLDVRIIIGSQLPRDPSKRAALRDNVLQLDSFGVKFYLVDNWHAKIWLSDSTVALGSANLNPINLGIRGTHNAWKANTEIIFVSHDKEEIANARNALREALKQGRPAIEIHYEKSERDISELLKAFGVDASPGARRLLGSIATSLQRRGLAEFQTMLNLARKIQNKVKAKKLEPIHVSSGVILWRWEKSATPIEQLREVVEETAGSNAEFEKAIIFMRDEVQILKVRNGIVSLNSIKLFEQ